MSKKDYYLYVYEGQGADTVLLARYDCAFSQKKGNKHQGVRAGLAWIPEIAHLCRQHNDANVLVMPGRFIDNKTAGAIMDNFFTTSFEGGRHERRVKKIDLEK